MDRKKISKIVFRPNFFEIGRLFGLAFDGHVNNICLTHWGRVTHISVSKLTIIVSDNGLSPGQRQAIIWTNAEILLTGTLGTNFNEMLIEIQKFSLEKIRLKVSSAEYRPFCLGLNVLKASRQISALQRLPSLIDMPGRKAIHNSQLHPPLLMNEHKHPFGIKNPKFQCFFLILSFS